MKTLDSISADAMRLSVDDKVILVHRLIDSYQTPDPKIEAAWAKEIKERIRKYDAGETKGIPSEEVFRNAEKLLRRIKRSRLKPTQ